MRHFRTGTLAVFLLLAARPLAAQIIPDEDTDPQDVAAYISLTATPVAGLAPVVSMREAGVAQSRIGFRFQFGHINESGPLSRRNIVGGVDLPFGQTTIGLTAGYMDLACDDSEFSQFGFTLDCGGNVSFGANLNAPLLNQPLGATQSAIFKLGIDASVGFGSGDLFEITGDDGFGGTSTAKFDHSSYAFGLSLPVSLAARSTSIVLVPHLRPGLGYGHSTLKFEETGSPSDEVSESGTSFMLGGGLGLMFSNQSLGLNVGFQRVFVKDAETVLGLGMTFGLR